MDKEAIESDRSRDCETDRKKGKNSKSPIQTVKDNKEKGYIYQEYMKRFQKAKESAFYFECLWILYAMIEDRTSAFLYYIGFTSVNRNSIVKKDKIKADVREIFQMQPNKNDYRLNKLNGKFERIQQIFSWCKAEHEAPSDYQKALIKALLPLADSDELRDALIYLNEDWRDKRNQIAHRLFNTSSDAVAIEMSPLVEQAYHAARQLDIAVKKVKPKNIRLKFHIQ